MRTVKTDQTGRMPRLICIFAGGTGNFVGFMAARIKFYFSQEKLDLWVLSEDWGREDKTHCRGVQTKFSCRKIQITCSKLLTTQTIFLSGFYYSVGLSVASVIRLILVFLFCFVFGFGGGVWGWWLLKVYLRSFFCLFFFYLFMCFIYKEWTLWNTDCG